MYNSMQPLSPAKNRSVLGTGLVVGLDFGLCAPGEKFFYACIGFDDGDSFRHLLDAFVYSVNELVIGEGKVGGAGGLQLLVLSLGDKEGERGGFGHGDA